MFIATVHKAERKTVVEAALVSSVIGIQSEGFSSNFLPLLWGPGDTVPLTLVSAFSVFWCHHFVINVQDGKISTAHKPTLTYRPAVKSKSEFHSPQCFSKVLVCFLIVMHFSLCRFLKEKQLSCSIMFDLDSQLCCSLFWNCNDTSAVTDSYSEFCASLVLFPPLPGTFCCFHQCKHTCQPVGDTFPFLHCGAIFFDWTEHL